MTNDDWVKNPAGIFVPPDKADPHVQRAEFAIKVVGFSPPAETKPPNAKGDYALGGVLQRPEGRPKTGA